MGIAALVLGIVSIIVSFIPFCGLIGLLPALIGLILGIVDVVKKSKVENQKELELQELFLQQLQLYSQLSII